MKTAPLLLSSRARAARRALYVLSPLAAALAVSAPAQALTIIPTYDATITSNPNAVTIEAGIQNAIDSIDSYIANPVTVTITFASSASGLGQSSTFVGSIAYSTYTGQLLTQQTASPNDLLARASLPADPASVSGSSTSQVKTSTPLLRALGFAANPPAGSTDSTITLNTSIMNLSRSGAQNSSFYDLQSTAAHEIDEVLGIGGVGSQLGSGTANIGPLDLFRFSANAVRSFTTSTSAVPYFSIDGGKTKFVNFNQAGGGSDYADWGNNLNPASASGNSPSQAQDAFGTPGAQSNIAGNELAALDVVGWNLTASGLAAESQVVPEPGTIALCAFGGLALLASAKVRSRKRRSSGQDGV